MLGNLIGGAVILALFIGIFLLIRKSGSDAAKKDAATDALKDINDALRPPTDDELKLVRDKYRRN